MGTDGYGRCLYAFGLAGCNTVKGVGKDVAALGNGVDHAATTVSNKM